MKTLFKSMLFIFLLLPIASCSGNGKTVNKDEGTKSPNDVVLKFLQGNTELLKLLLNMWKESQGKW
ncbi:MAG: hypothetical protein ACTTKH_06000 [Treponema sp.]